MLTSSATVRITAEAPVITSVNPASGQQGQQNLPVALTGQFTNWVQQTTTASFGVGITAASLTVNSSTSATAVLNIDPTATTGPRTVTVTTGTEVVALANGFTVTAGVTGGPLTISTTSLPDAIIGEPYNAALSATGGTTPYAWGLASGSGALPSQVPAFPARSSASHR